jgi:hypothetical protein
MLMLRIQGTRMQKTHVFNEVSLHLQNVQVWCTNSFHCISGHFFETTVTGHIYWNLVTQFSTNFQSDKQGCWLQQDGGTCHTLNETIETLQNRSVITLF